MHKNLSGNGKDLWKILYIVGVMIEILSKNFPQ